MDFLRSRQALMGVYSTLIPAGDRRVFGAGRSHACRGPVARLQGPEGGVVYPGAERIEDKEFERVLLGRTSHVRQDQAQGPQGSKREVGRRAGGEISRQVPGAEEEV